MGFKYNKKVIEAAAAQERWAAGKYAVVLSESDTDTDEERGLALWKVSFRCLSDADDETSMTGLPLRQTLVLPLESDAEADGDFDAEQKKYANMRRNMSFKSVKSLFNALMDDVPPVPVKHGPRAYVDEDGEVLSSSETDAMFKAQKEFIGKRSAELFDDATEVVGSVCFIEVGHSKDGQYVNLRAAYGACPADWEDDLNTSPRG